MRAILAKAERDDLKFFVTLLSGFGGFVDRDGLALALHRYEEEDTAASHAELIRLIEREIGYVASADVAYLLRVVRGRTPGIALAELIGDVAKRLGMKQARLGAPHQQLVDLVEFAADETFRKLPAAEQRRLLKAHGADQVAVDRVLAPTPRSAKLTAIPVMYAVLGPETTVEIVHHVLGGMLSSVLGRDVTKALMAALARRLLGVRNLLGPAVWATAAAAAFYELQTPATRKTVPITLYLGLMSLRED